MKFLIYLLVLFSLFLLTLNFLAINIVEDNNVFNRKEKFDPTLSRLNSLNKLKDYVDSVTASKNIADNSLAYALEAEDIVSHRFYHKYATMDLKENWLASVCQKGTGYFLSSEVRADDILKKQYGYCGQQNAVLMELLQKKNFDYRVIYFPHHLVFQSYINNQWCYFDADLEPSIKTYQRASEKWLNNTDSLSLAYKMDKTNAGQIFGAPVHYKLGKINEVQGKNLLVFQFITKIISKIAFVFPLLLILFIKKRQKKEK